MPRPWIHLERFQNKETGLFPAAVCSANPLMNMFAWDKDMYDVFRVVDDYSKGKLISAMAKSVDMDEENGKFDFSNTDWMKEYVHVHPFRHVDTLEEKADGWPFVQLDSVGNKLEILSIGGMEKQSHLLVDYLGVVPYNHEQGFFKCLDYGYFETGPRQLRSSSLAACISGLETFQRYCGRSRIVAEMIDLGYRTMNTLLPNETETRKADAALLTVLRRKHMITERMKDQILQNLQPLIGEYGVKRWFGDTWDGIDWTLGLGIEMQWFEFLFDLFLITEDRKYFERAKEIIQEQRLRYVCEGFVHGRPNCTPFFLRGTAKYREAELKYRELKATEYI